MPRPFIRGDNAALLTDLYELTMAQAYLAEGMTEEGVFSLFVRTLPQARNYLLACGLDDALGFLETLRFGSEELETLRGLGIFSDAFLSYLEGFRFEGDVHAMPEGTPFFAGEPLLEVVAPLVQAQLAETIIMNQLHGQTVFASKAARVVQAAQGRAVVDFGLRRAQGADAGLKAARAFHVAGLSATSNVLAAQHYGVPVTGTMAHSYIEAHDDELNAFRAFTREFPNTVLLVDTYDTLEGVCKVVRLAAELGDRFQVRGVRLDSGDLAELAFESRRLLDAAGLHGVRIIASGGLSDLKIERLVKRGAPIDGFGVGTDLSVSEDVPALDLAYKLAEYGGQGRLKLSSGKHTLPGRKQVFRVEVDGRYDHDVLGRAGEQLAGRPLLRRVMAKGERLADAREDLETLRRRAGQEIAKLPERVRSLAPAEPPYDVRISDALRAHLVEVRDWVRLGPT